ncbi:peptidyl-prolyl cis-trans isomerase fkr-3 [Trichocladium antarcticum]|uniref:peptidylprolyl isomerase n=1 Tax=Trichocladium antarcticum TaxID=1450529 RepID=A0AAN6UC93_9PEZI|nr:peptidyl-prolyl cis-trans isomerase fkr-3 [Trichocladium antarcticum]
MAVTRTTRVPGTGQQPARGQTVTMTYTGWLKDTSQPGNKGQQFDSCIGKADFEVEIGVGRVILGEHSWDEAVLDMRVGEHATLDITSDYAYGERHAHPNPAGFRGHIPPNADLIL